MTAHNPSTTPRAGAKQPVVVALDTSSAASVAVVADDRVDAEWAQSRARRHAELLGQALTDVLKQASEPELVAVGVGPAPFTGMRAGIASGLGLAVGRGLRTVGVRSHDGLALAVYEQLRADGEDVDGVRILVASDARRREVYWAEYAGLDEDGLPVLAAGPDVAKPADLAELKGLGPVDSSEPRPTESSPKEPGSTEPTVLRIGAGFELYADVLGAPDPRFPTEALAADIARIAARTEAAGREQLEPIPLYLREPDAKPLPGR